MALVLVDVMFFVHLLIVGMWLTKCTSAIHNCSYYTFNKNIRNWKESKEYCKQNGGDLVSMETEEEYQFINETMQSLNEGNGYELEWYIGLSNRSGLWRWISNHSLDINKWQPNRPRQDEVEPRRDCVIMAKSFPLGTHGLFNDLQCRIDRMSICEYKNEKGNETKNARVYNSCYEINDTKKNTHTTPQGPTKNVLESTSYKTKEVNTTSGTRKQSTILRNTYTTMISSTAKTDRNVSKPFPIMVVIIVLAVLLAVCMFIAVFCWLRNKSRKTPGENIFRKSSETGIEIRTTEQDHTRLNNIKSEGVQLIGTEAIYTVPLDDTDYPAGSQQHDNINDEDLSTYDEVQDVIAQYYNLSPTFNDDGNQYLTPVTTEPTPYTSLYATVDLNSKSHQVDLTSKYDKENQYLKDGATGPSSYTSLCVTTDLHSKSHHDKENEHVQHGATGPSSYTSLYATVDLNSKQNQAIDECSPRQESIAPTKEHKPNECQNEPHNANRNNQQPSRDTIIGGSRKSMQDEPSAPIPYHQETGDTVMYAMVDLLSKDKEANKEFDNVVYAQVKKILLLVRLECPLINVTANRENCKLPVLDPHSKDIVHMVPTFAPMKCDDKELYTALDNNILRLREDKRNDTNLLHVVAQPIRRPDIGVRRDFSYHLGEPRYLTRAKTSFKLEEDLWKVTTKLTNGSMLTTYHMSVVEKQEVLSRMLPTDAPLDIIIIEMDGTSEAHFRRMLPMTHAFLKDELGSYMFKGYSVVGDATLPNANAMLTGNTVEENKEQHSNDENVDNWPLLFKDLKNNGFTTMWSEDYAWIGLYTLTLPGFKDPPTDHYARPLWLSGAEGMCLGGQFQVKLQLDYLKSFMTSYPRRRKFGFTFLCDLCHRTLNLVSIADLEMVTFLKKLKKENRFNESMFIMTSDHGARFGEIRTTHQGKLEERLPFLSITLPPWFKKKFPERVANLQRNTEIITSPFDLYATFVHLLSFSKPSVKKKIGTSLFEALPKNRTCKDAGITDQWCPCLEWYPVDPAHPQVIGCARHAVLRMNQNLAKYELSNRLCKRIRLKRILNAVQTISTNDIGSKHVDRCIYQIQIETTPGDAKFEVTVQVMNTGLYNVIGEVSRINAYGSTAECIESKVPAVRKYCYCK